MKPDVNCQGIYIQRKRYRNHPNEITSKTLRVQPRKVVHASGSSWRRKTERWGDPSLVQLSMGASEIQQSDSDSRKMATRRLVSRNDGGKAVKFLEWHLYSAKITKKRIGSGTKNAEEAAFRKPSGGQFQSLQCSCSCFPVSPHFPAFYSSSITNYSHSLPL